jgi:hypothetical protein
MAAAGGRVITGDGSVDAIPEEPGFARRIGAQGARCGAGGGGVMNVVVTGGSGKAGRACT